MANEWGVGVSKFKDPLALLLSLETPCSSAKISAPWLHSFVSRNTSLLGRNKWPLTLLLLSHEHLTPRPK